MGTGRRPTALKQRLGAALTQRRRRVAAAVLLLAGAIWFWRLAPDPLFAAPESSVLLARNGELLGARIAADGQWRFPAAAEVPRKYRDALIEYEDRRFESHPGVDPVAIVRALRQNWRSDRVVSGASTLTMQVARLSRAPLSTGEGGDRRRKRGLVAKVADSLLALRLELSYSKQEILALHASHAPFGGNVVGLEAAAWRYFGRAPQRLSWAEVTTLAVLPNQPALVTPGRNRARLQQKRDSLLQRLQQAGKLDALELQAALAEPLVGAPVPLPDEAPHLLETLRRQFPGQHRFTSTLDASLQHDAMRLVSDHAAQLQRQEIHNAAALIIDNRSFEVLAYVGNADWSVRNERGFAVDIIRRPRSTGSILKPFLYAAMLDSGQLLPRMLLTDVPTQIAGFSPENFDRDYRGAVPADVALAQSLNIPAVRLLREYGVDRFYDLLKSQGMSTLRQSPSHYGLTLVLGGSEGNLWDITRMHAGLVDAARRQEDDARPPPAPLTVLTDSKPGAANRHANGVDSSGISPGAAWLTLRALLEVPRPAEEGSWRLFASSRQIAWKTGTSWGQRDAWAIGSSGSHTVGVWAGNASGEGRPGLTGAVAAAPLMFALHNRLPAATWIAQPSRALKRVQICGNDGYLANDVCATEAEWVPIASHFEKQSPYNQLVHLDTSGRQRVDDQCESVTNMQHVGWFVLPATQEFYYQRHHAAYRELPSFRADCNVTANNGRQMMDFIYPNTGATIYIPLDLDGQRGRVVLEAVHRDPNAQLLWHLDGEFAGRTRTYHQLPVNLPPGEHVVTVVDSKGNRFARMFNVMAREGIVAARAN